MQQYIIEKKQIKFYILVITKWRLSGTLQPEEFTKEQLKVVSLSSYLTIFWSAKSLFYVAWEITFQWKSSVLLHIH